MYTLKSQKVGSSDAGIETPSLVIDLDILEENISTMADFFRHRDANLRPHTKTHKSPFIAHKQIEAGACGVTCAKLSEAEVTIFSGIPDVLIANQIVTKDKIEKLVGLAKHSSIIVAVDNIGNVKNLSAVAEQRNAALNVIIETDVGLGRAGTRTHDESISLARLIRSLPGLVFRGIMGYEGHSVQIAGRVERKEKANAALSRLVDTKRMIEEQGIPVEIVSAGGTGTFNIAGAHPGVTEVQAGSYVTMDSKYRGVQGMKFRQALYVLATVTSRPTADIAILDVGMKGITPDYGMPLLKDYSGSSVIKLSEEHAIVQTDRTADQLAVGERVYLLPSHGCTTVNLYDQYAGVRNGVVEVVFNIPARGALV